ncbi:hypothetical protein [Geodermatophilus sp. SYSU D00700]
MSSTDDCSAEEQPKPARDTGIGITIGRVSGEGHAVGISSDAIAAVLGYTAAAGSAAAAFTGITRAALERNKDKEIELTAEGQPIKFKGYSAQHIKAMTELLNRQLDRQRDADADPEGSHETEPSDDPEVE